MANAYTRAGVNVKAGYEVINRIKKYVKKTKRLGVMGELGNFGACFDLSSLNIKEPVLISGTDGVGTKLLLAINEDKHNTVGIDCVAMCVNDIVANGAEPLYFLDYIATGKNIPDRLEQVVAGVVEGCYQANAALIGGESAEMPGMYGKDEYDLAGFAVGVAEKSELVTGENIQAGDVLLGLSSSGIHSNGYSLVRKVFFEQNGFDGLTLLPELNGKTLAEELLTPTRIYVKILLPLIKRKLIKGIAHITGGGFIENIPRMFDEGLAAEILEGTWPILPIFEMLEKYGKISHNEMFEIFNMGLGMVLTIDAKQKDAVAKEFQNQGEMVYEIGKVIEQKDDLVIIS
ncbi:MAG: phosphoribosylformylglycinamidine cyclo-ligase [Streptococcaceae bacterium]|jgi:phosphoribosylformylglycinamidine cyclo-ligase|nr:phosphoribosylformylglycinamidine cyclo-ligase [Streptococcaceae bacterium]